MTVAPSWLRSFLPCRPQPSPRAGPGPSGPSPNASSPQQHQGMKQGGQRAGLAHAILVDTHTAMGSTELDEEQPAPTMLRKELGNAKVVIISEQ